MGNELKYQETFNSLMLDNEYRPALHIEWSELSSHASKLLTGVLGREIYAEADREEFYYWRLLLGRDPISEDELNILLEAADADIGDCESYDPDSFPATELYQDFSRKLISKILPFTATDSIADEKGVWFLGDKTTAREKPYFFTMKVHHHRDDREIATRTGIVFAENNDQAEEKAWSKYGSDSSCKLDVWEVSGDSESFCAYYPNRGCPQ